MSDWIRTVTAENRTVEIRRIGTFTLEARHTDRAEPYGYDAVLICPDGTLRMASHLSTLQKTKNVCVALMDKHKPEIVAWHLRWLREDMSYHSPKLISGDRIAVLHRFIYTDAILVMKLGDTTGYDDRWCYERGKAEGFLESWDGKGEPDGWHRHPSTGRRRPDGDASCEYIDF
jgi:hypothetical protein